MGVLSGSRPNAQRPASHASGLVPLAAILYVAAAVGALIWIRWRVGELSPALFVDAQSWGRDLAIGVGAGAAMLAGWWLARRYVALCRRLEAEFRELLEGIGAGEAAALAVLSAVAEELFFRGAVQGAWGYPVATVLFGLLHTGPRRAFAVWTLSALGAGAVLGGLVLWRQNLLPAMVAHAVVNGVQLERLRRGSPPAETASRSGTLRGRYEGPKEGEEGCDECRQQ